MARNGKTDVRHRHARQDFRRGSPIRQFPPCDADGRKCARNLTLKRQGNIQRHGFLHGGMARKPDICTHGTAIHLFFRRKDGCRFGGGRVLRHDAGKRHTQAKKQCQTKNVLHWKFLREWIDKTAVPMKSFGSVIEYSVEHILDHRRRERSELRSVPPPHGNAAWRERGVEHGLPCGNEYCRLCRSKTIRPAQRYQHGSMTEPILFVSIPSRCSGKGGGSAGYRGYHAESSPVSSRFPGVQTDVRSSLSQNGIMAQSSASVP